MVIGIIIQARMGSTRLPGKIMKDLGGREILWRVVERCRKSNLANKVIIATSNEKGDDAIYNFCLRNGIDVFRGSLDNVLERYYECAKKYNLDVIVRITSDCPLIDPFIIDQTIDLFLRSNVDYVSNCLQRIFPRGLDCEVFSFKALTQAHKNAATNDEREHVTMYIVKHCSTAPYFVPKEYEGNFRLTVDEEDDYRLLKLIYDKFKTSDGIIDVKDVIKFLKQYPDIASINTHIEQKKSIG